MRQPLIFYPGDTYSNADELLNVVLSYQQNFVSHQGNNNAKPDQIFFANLSVTCAFTFLHYLRAKPKFVQKRSFYCGFFLKRRECNQCDKFNIFYIWGLTVSQENVAETQQPMIEAVLDTGVDWNSVMQVIEKRLIETGRKITGTVWLKS